jgi:predicted nucleotidyltransferase
MVRSGKHPSRPSGRFVLRIEPGLHATLRAAAAALNVSLNEYCERKLALPIGSSSALSPAHALVERAAAWLGGDLIGVVAFGSWARGEAGPSSDVDALIVVDAPRRVTRSLYREWDEAPLSWHEHPVEPHFVHLPDPANVGTLWAEAAIDGIVLFERTLEVSRALADIRRQIVAGKLVRKLLHGQPYWSEVA